LYIRDIIYKNNMTVISTDKYNIGEILVKILNYDFEKISEEITHLHIKAQLFETENDCDQIIGTLEDIQELIQKIQNLIFSTPLYNICGTEDEDDIELKFDYWIIDFDEYFRDKYKDYENLLSIKFLKEHDVKGKEIYDKITAEIRGFLQLGLEILNTQKIYSRLIDDYLLIDKKSEDLFAETIFKFNKYWDNELPKTPKLGLDYLENFNFSFIMRRKYESKHDIDKDGNLEETLTFSSLGDFMYYEFFKAYEVGNTIKRCKNCGKFFLNTKKYAMEYCDNIFDKKTNRTCREIGAEKSYKNKVQNNPVLLAYQRAYKTHYARVLKKKMTKSEFTKWGDWSIELREKALKNEIHFDEYEELLKK